MCPARGERAYRGQCDRAGGASRVVALATDTDVGALSEWSADGSAILLGTETTQMAATATLSGSEQALAHVRVRAGEDSVTAVATDPDDAAPPFGEVMRGT
ncbi:MULTISPECIES: hypothetical protein [unclassified Haloarcula]|uniref:hypothetical protein n=1 Tax=unclassified Haloarcula TaxID=2624677 RepID=UPI001CD9E9F9|nr:MULTISPECIES: hypothetical protein [unclassified Haloarcula]